MIPDGLVAVVVETVRDQQLIWPTLFPALSTAMSCHSPLAGDPFSAVSASVGLKLPANGALPVEIDALAALSKTVGLAQLEPKLLPAPPTRADRKSTRLNSSHQI